MLACTRVASSAVCVEDFEKIRNISQTSHRHRFPGPLRKTWWSWKLLFIVTQRIVMTQRIKLHCRTRSDVKSVSAWFEQKRMRTRPNGCFCETPQHLILAERIDNLWRFTKLLWRLQVNKDPLQQRDNHDEYTKRQHLGFDKQSRRYYIIRKQFYGEWSSAWLREKQQQNARNKCIVRRMVACLCSRIVLSDVSPWSGLE